jgi:hypothetical protein
LLGLKIYNTITGRVKRMEYLKKIAIFEAKYGKSYEAFSQSVPDTVKGHDDWIEWSYLVKVANEKLP